MWKPSNEETVQRVQQILGIVIARATLERLLYSIKPPARTIVLHQADSCIISERIFKTNIFLQTVQGAKEPVSLGERTKSR